MDDTFAGKICISVAHSTWFWLYVGSWTVLFPELEVDWEGKGSNLMLDL